jgi:hypothetical protein
MTFVLGPEVNGTGNGDVSVRTHPGGVLVALIYARSDAEETRRYAEVACCALNAAFRPSMTDMMVTPEQLDAWLEQNPPSA